MLLAHPSVRLEPLGCMLRQSHHFTKIDWCLRAVNFLHLTGNKHLTTSILQLLQNTQFSHQQYSSHSFRGGTNTTAAAAGISEWLIKILGLWRSNAYQVYIHSSPAMLQSIPLLLVHASIPDTDSAPTE